MHYLLFDSAETAEYYYTLVNDPDTRVTAEFPTGYYVTEDDITALYKMNLSINGVLQS